MKRLFVACAMVGVLAACGASDAAPATSAPTTTTTTVSTTSTTTAATTVPTTSTTTAATTVPTTTAATTVPTTTAATPKANHLAHPSTDADFAEILERLEARLVRGVKDPSNFEVDQYCVMGSGCEEVQTEVVDNLVAADERVVGMPRFEVSSINTIHDLSKDEGSGYKRGDAFEISFTWVDKSEQFGKIVDSNGDVVVDITAGDEYPVVTMIIVRTEQDKRLPWRRAD